MLRKITNSFSIVFVLVLLPFLSDGKKPCKIKISELRDKIAGEWIGQLIGNMYGLPHECKYIAEPGAEKWPYGYSKSLDKLQKCVDISVPTFFLMWELTRFNVALFKIRCTVH